MEFYCALNLIKRPPSSTVDFLKKWPNPWIFFKVGRTKLSNRNFSESYKSNACHFVSLAEKKLAFFFLQIYHCFEKKTQKKSSTKLIWWKIDLANFTINDILSNFDLHSSTYSELQRLQIHKSCDRDSARCPKLAELYYICARQ